ncbi:MAG: inositol monophosphatase [Bacteroidetes bacterium]|jgi:myo-inositol-1(or 4)-monophosphatase|nr:inositol monophosphatase [Bacteroidota bacterium]
MYTHARDVAIRAATQAARLIRYHMGGIDEERIEHKGVHDLVTHVDEAAQEVVVKTLRAAFPGHAILAEEGATDAPAAPEGYRWIIDPIDGTTNFTRGCPPYAVSIGLQHEGAMVVGVVLEVTNDDLFTAVQGGGAYQNGRPIHVTDNATLERALIATGFPYTVFDYMDTYTDVLQRFLKDSRGLRRHGAASVDLVRVANGTFDGFYETGLSPWDVAAGMVVVTEAGGQVTDFSNDANALFGSQMIASNGAIHDAILDRVQPLRDIHH